LQTQAGWKALDIGQDAKVDRDVGLVGNAFIVCFCIFIMLGGKESACLWYPRTPQPDSRWRQKGRRMLA